MAATAVVQDQGGVHSPRAGADGSGTGATGAQQQTDPSADAAAKALDALADEFENLVDETINDEEQKIGTLRAGLLKANCTQLAARYATEFAALTASAFSESFPACRLGEFMVTDLSRVATQLGHLNDETLALLAEEPRDGRDPPRGRTHPCPRVLSAPPL